MTHQTGPTLDFDQYGSYNPGLFYSESFSGVPWESELLLPKEVGRHDSPFTAIGRVPGGPQKTQRLIVLLHETGHYLHDLSLGVALEYERLLDESGAILFHAIRTMTHPAPLPCPLLDGDAVVVDLPDQEALRLIAVAAQRFRLARDLMDESVPVPDPLINEAVLPPDLLVTHLSTRDLLEGVVAAKTAEALAGRGQAAEDVAYLARHKRRLQILPEDMPGLYNAARRLYDSTLGRMIWGDLTNASDTWPLDYFHTARHMSDIGFLYLADIALHTPPSEYAGYRMEQGLNEWEDFFPPSRFCQAILALAINGGFPDADPAGPDTYHHFYRTLFDFVAEHQERPWPTISETNGVWLDELRELKQSRRSISDGYRFRMVAERDLRPNAVVLEDAISVLAGQVVPIFHLTPTGFKLLFSVAGQEQTIVMPSELPEMPVLDLMRYHGTPWKDMTGAVPLDRAIEDYIEKGRTFQQEVVFRSFFATLQSAIFEESCLSCPFARRGCQAAVPDCAHIVHLDQMPAAGCSLRLYLAAQDFPGDRIRWGESHQAGGQS